MDQAHLGQVLVAGEAAILRLRIGLRDLRLVAPRRVGRPLLDDAGLVDDTCDASQVVGQPVPRCVAAVAPAGVDARGPSGVTIQCRRSVTLSGASELLVAPEVIRRCDAGGGGRDLLDAVVSGAIDVGQRGRSLARSSPAS